VGEWASSALAGKRIVVTRTVAQSGELFEALRARGAEPVLIPLIRIVPVEDYGPLDAALSRLRSGDWIVLTSQNAVAPVAQRGRMLRDESFGAAEGIQVAAVGPASENAARAAGLTVDYVAKSHDGVSLAHELGERLRGRRVLLPRSDLAGAELPAAVQRYGAEAMEVVAYCTEQVHEYERELKALVAEGGVDAIICFSPSAVHSLARVLGAARLTELQDKLVFAAIGEVTARAYRHAGVREPLAAKYAGSEATVNVLNDYFARRSQQALAGAKKL